MVDRVPFVTVGTSLSSLNRDEKERTRHHGFAAWGSKINDTRPRNSYHSGGHAFVGPGVGGIFRRARRGWYYFVSVSVVLDS